MTTPTHTSHTHVSSWFTHQAGPSSAEQERPSSSSCPPPAGPPMAFSPEDHLHCPVCHDVFRDPLVLSCSHSFCRDCAKSWWDVTKTRLCPLCKRKTSKSKTPCNLVLKNICEDFARQRAPGSSDPSRRPGSGGRDLQGSGADAPAPLNRNDPKFKPVIRAAQSHKRELQEALPALRDKLRCLEEARGRLDQTAENMDVLVQHVGKKMRTQVETLHRFLEKEEEAKLRALRREEERAARALRDKMEELGRDIGALTDTLRDTEEGLAEDEVDFLLRYKALKERVQLCLQLDAPPQPAGPLIDEARLMDNAACGFWSRRTDALAFACPGSDQSGRKQEVVDGDDCVLELIVYVIILVFVGLVLCFL